MPTSAIRRPSAEIPKHTGFDVDACLGAASLRRKLQTFRTREIIFSQGEYAPNVMYIQDGGLKLVVVNSSGKEAVVAILGPGDFVGEGCLAGQLARTATAIAITPATLLVIEKQEMVRVLHSEHAFSDRFLSHILTRYIRVEEDLIDQLFNSSEKRLARTLLLLARYGKKGESDRVIAKISQNTLAEIVGTTRPRINFFMNKFRKLGFIDYRGDIHVRSSLLAVVLHD